MKNTLLIIDPQNDFITGTLPVPTAEEAMKLLSEQLSKLPIDTIVVTMDCHPFGHCSFAEAGGPWPVHCVKYSPGAAIYEPLFQALYKWSEGGQRQVLLIEKGTNKEQEEYSAFHATYPTLFDQSEHIYVSGIAGNVCVMNSIQDLARLGLAEKMVVLTDVCPSLDDGTALQETITNLNLRSEKITNL